MFQGLGFRSLRGTHGSAALPQHVANVNVVADVNKVVFGLLSCLTLNPISLEPCKVWSLGFRAP